MKIIDRMIYIIFSVIILIIAMVVCFLAFGWITIPTISLIIDKVMNSGIATKVSIGVCILLIIFAVSKEPVSFKEELTYVDDNVKVSNIYLLDGYQFVSLTTIGITKDETVDKAKEIIEVLIEDGIGESKIPSGFKSMINSETKLNKITQ